MSASRIDEAFVAGFKAAGLIAKAVKLEEWKKSRAYSNACRAAQIAEDTAVYRNQAIASEIERRILDATPDQIAALVAFDRPDAKEKSA